MSPDALVSEIAIGPPGHALFTNGDESLVCSVMNALAGVRVRIAGRFMHLDGRVEPIVQTFVPASDRSVSVNRVLLAKGWLLNAQASVVAGAPQTGQTFAILSLVRGRTGAFEELATLAAGPISAVHRLAWPGSPIVSSVEGAGTLRLINGTTPAVGVDVFETVPTGARWQLLYFKVNLVTSAAAANRVANLTFDDGTNFYAVFPMHTAVVASQNRNLYWANGLDVKAAASASGFIQGIGVTPLLSAGHRISTGTTAIDAGDQYSSVRYAVREWIEGA